MVALWRRGWDIYLYPQRFSRPEYACADPVLRHLFRGTFAGAVAECAVVASPFGLALNAARQVPGAGADRGAGPARLKLVAFVISGGDHRAGGGALFADLNRLCQPADVFVASVG